MYLSLAFAFILALAVVGASVFLALNGSVVPAAVLREDEENNLPQMKKLFFLYVWLNLTRPECFRDKENLVKHIRKRTIQTGRLFFSSSLTGAFTLAAVFITRKNTNTKPPEKS